MKKLLIVAIGIALVWLGILGYNQYVQNKILEDYPDGSSIEENPDYKKSSTYMSDEKIFYTSQLFMEEKLKAPKTAQFAPFHKSTVKRISTNRYSVSSYVDSQNSFGALLRTNYVMEIEKNEDGGVSLVKFESND